MGGACCVAARERTLTSRTNNEAFHRNIRYSPSWSFRWDNRGRVAGEMEDHPQQYCHGVGGNVGLEIKSQANLEIDASDGGSPMENFRMKKWRKSSIIHDRTAGNFTTPASDLSNCSSFSAEVKELAETSARADPSERKLSFSTHSASPLSTPKVDPSFSQSYAASASTPSKHARQSPGRQLLRGISDSGVLGSKSPSNPVSEGRQSFNLSTTCSNDVNLGSQGSDGWSMRTFSELVASSQRERWSFDSEIMDSGRSRITRSSSHLLGSPSEDIQLCGLCSRLVTERCSWINNELAVVAILVCGHVYHADCLEKMTPETDKYDPKCPACTAGEKHALKFSMRALRAEADLKARYNRISRNRVIDSDIDGDMVFTDICRSVGMEGRGPKLGSSSSLKSSFAKPFLKRHFSLSSRSTRALSINEPSAKKKGFWARYRRE
ncbi:hypothetical protein Syun_015632 [Stephania yunnanensis]|uniref:RING-type domain-containing protein n=1 Tax=Stephania yunnanensis TaxID=152371 RepID=A0AAP0JLQ4_9MAGN